MILDQRTENIAISIPVFQHSKSGISMVNCEESVSPSLNRLLSSQAYEWTGTADVETHTHTHKHIKLKQITGGVLGLTLKYTERTLTGTLTWL